MNLTVNLSVLQTVRQHFGGRKASFSMVNTGSSSTGLTQSVQTPPWTPVRRITLKISIRMNIDTIIPVTSPKKRADAVGRSFPKKTEVPMEFKIDATTPASITSRQFTRFDLCSLKSIPSLAKNQKLSAAQNTPKNTAIMYSTENPSDP